MDDCYNRPIERQYLCVCVCVCTYIYICVCVEDLRWGVGQRCVYVCVEYGCWVCQTVLMHVCAYVYVGEKRGGRS